MRREDGSVLLLVLMVGVILMALLAAEVTITRVNLRSVDAATVNAQLDVQAVLSTPNVIRSVVARLPDEVQRRVVIDTSDAGVSSVQRSVEQDWATCSASYKVIFDATACGLLSGTAETRASKRPVGLTTEIRLPVVVQYTYASALGRRTRQARGEVVYRATGSALPVGTFVVLADELGAGLPSTAIFDGPVHVNGTLKFGAGRSEFLAGVSSAAAQVQLGDTTVLSAAQFAPSPSLPCDQLSLSCPKFDAGLSVTAPRLVLPTLTARPDVVLSPLVTELVLTPSPNGGTVVYACAASSCERYWYSSIDTDGKLYRHVLASPVPPTDGQPFSSPEPQDPTQAWQPLGTTSPTHVLLAPGDLQVRSLTPTGTAYEQRLTVAATGTLTVTSSLNPVHLACSTFAVLGDDGALIPAACRGAGPDQLGLVSLTGDINVGNTATAAPAVTMTMQASLLAPLGAVRLADPAVTHLDWIGSAAAHIFTPDARMRLAYNVESDPPGFPTLVSSANASGLGTTPPTLRLDPDGPVGLSEGE